MSQLSGMNPYTIGGNLSFGQAPAQDDYMGAYQNALNLNKQNYENILQGYQGLNTSVLGNLQNAGLGQAQAIENQYAMEGGKQAQGLISRGLGNTTVANSVQRGLAYSKSQALNELMARMAQLYAGYQSQLGGQQLKFMEGVNAPYPNAQLYMQNALQRGLLAALQKGYGAGMGAGGGGFRVAGQLAPLRGGGGGSLGGGGGGGFSSTGLPAYRSNQGGTPQNLEDFGGIGGGGSWEEVGAGGGGSWAGGGIGGGGSWDRIPGPYEDPFATGGIGGGGDWGGVGGSAGGGYGGGFGGMLASAVGSQMFGRPDTYAASGGGGMWGRGAATEELGSAQGQGIGGGGNYLAPNDPYAFGSQTNLYSDYGSDYTHAFQSNPDFDVYNSGNGWYDSSGGYVEGAQPTYDYSQADYESVE